MEEKTETTMIICQLSELPRYEALHPRFAQLFQFLSANHLAELPTGRVTLDGVDLYINVDEGTLRSKAEQPLEAHRHYIDVQIPLTEGESMGWCPLDQATDVIEAYDEQLDRMFCKATETVAYLPVKPGQAVIFFPEDAHAPIIGSGHFRKLVAKVKI